MFASVLERNTDALQRKRQAPEKVLDGLSECEESGSS